MQLPLLASFYLSFLLLAKENLFRLWLHNFNNNFFFFLLITPLDSQLLYPSVLII